MKKIILLGRSEAGKTTLKQALRGEKIVYQKTQYVNYYDVVIDTPGEYIETRRLGGALAVYSYEADVIGLLAGATEPFSLFSPNIVSLATRDVIGIVTKCDQPRARVELVKSWLEESGCKTIFLVDSVTGRGITDIFDYLSEEGDLLPWKHL